MSPRRITPILILTGFLGSGKTSLLAQWLKSPALAGALVIINELGEVGIDDRLVESSFETPLLLENGCACCAAGEDLSATLERLFWQQLQREIPPMSQILIETTGIADPEPILARLAANELLRERFRVTAVVTVFDARHGIDQLARYPECRKQLEAATLVVLSKADLASAEECAAAEAAIRRLAPKAAIRRSARASLDAASMLALVAEDAGGRPHAPAPRDHAPHHHDHDHALPHAAHAEDVSSAFLPVGRALPRGLLAEALGALSANFGTSLLRLKGICRIDGVARLQSVQLSPDEGLLVEAVAERGTPPRTGLTIIAQHAPATELAAFLAGRLDVPKGQPPLPMPSAGQAGDAGHDRPVS